MIAAGLYYALTLLLAIISKTPVLAALVLFWSIPFMLFSVIDTIRYKKPIHLLTLPICFVLYIIVSLAVSQPTINPTKITLSVNNISFDDLNQEKQIDYTIEPQNATVTSVKFYSENDNIAKFDSNKVKAVAEGETYVYAEIENTDIKSEKIKVTVKDKQKDIERAAKPVIDKINSIGEVTLESRALIDSIENDYNALSAEAKAKVTNYTVFITAKNSLDKLEKAEQDKQAAKAQEAEKSAKSEQSSSKSNGAAASSSSVEDAPTTSSSGGGTVYIGNTGNKYHRQDCRTLKGKGHPISIDEARRQGRTACKVCGG